jgi:hypothetical protein
LFRTSLQKTTDYLVDLTSCHGETASGLHLVLNRLVAVNKHAADGAHHLTPLRLNLDLVCGAPKREAADCTSLRRNVRRRGTQLAGGLGSRSVAQGSSWRKSLWWLEWSKGAANQGGRSAAAHYKKGSTVITAGDEVESPKSCFAPLVKISWISFFERQGP